ncbi:olfactory receptor 5V1-like [Pleurodeles waltl]|uniref:olfactory receptor 5V1-like n=1 Tax=Pleurodeles waltl TaxID=8319 RepID=UPI003709B413
MEDKNFAGKNLSSLQHFLIVGFSDLPQMQIPLFVIFSLMYLMALLGNLIIMATIYARSQLQTPMYFFLSNLAFLDISYISAIFPQMLAHYFQNGRSISLTECLLQIYFFIYLVSTEFFLLTVMAYDRYVAICNPLHYTTIMNRTFCMQLASGSWALSFLVPLAHTVLMSKLTFCQPHRLNHFFCDVAALLKISCSNTHIIDMITYTLGATVLLISFLSIITSYVNITVSIQKIKSKRGRQKAFSTCASHLTVVILFYGSLSFAYVRPSSTYSLNDNKVMSLSYIVVTPLCNPIIYGIRNTDFKNALWNSKNRP